MCIGYKHRSRDCVYIPVPNKLNHFVNCRHEGKNGEINGLYDRSICARKCTGEINISMYNKYIVKETHGTS